MNGVQMSGKITISPTDRFIVMQSMDLKDKNGQPVYEGDILRQSIHTSYKFGEIGYIEFNEDCGGFIVKGKYSKNQYYDQLTCDLAIECEVIGNMYQHPELLN